MAKQRRPLTAAELAFVADGTAPATAEVSAPPAPPKSPPPPAPPKPTNEKPIRFTLDMEPAQHKALQLAAFERGVKMSVIAREALQQWLNSASK